MASGQVTFVSPTAHLSFALTVPTVNNNDSNNTDLYFGISMPSSLSWGAVGLGNNKMQHTLILMVYSSASGKNVTLSPRLSPKHGEPVYDPSVKFTTLDGTGIVNGTLSYYGVCHNCRSWTGGSIDVTSTAQAAIFANGPSGSIANDAGDAPIKYHAEYGAFLMDMTAAAGSAAAPVLGALSNTTALLGTKLDGATKTGASDMVALIHAVLMIVTFFFLMPLGVLILRVGQSVRWHGINQGLSLLGAVGGSVMGFTTSSSYVRVGLLSILYQLFVPL